jgi:hypothetical protein
MNSCTISIYFPELYLHSEGASQPFLFSRAESRHDRLTIYFLARVVPESSDSTIDCGCFATQDLNVYKHREQKTTIHFDILNEV